MNVIDITRRLFSNNKSIKIYLKKSNIPIDGIKIFTINFRGNNSYTLTLKNFAINDRKTSILPI